MSWRVGTKLGRTLYVDDLCVGMVDTPELAAAIVAAMNGAAAVEHEARAKVIAELREEADFGSSGYDEIMAAADKLEREGKHMSKPTTADVETAMALIESCDHTNKVSLCLALAPAIAGARAKEREFWATALERWAQDVATEYPSHVAGVAEAVALLRQNDRRGLDPHGEIAGSTALDREKGGG